MEYHRWALPRINVYFIKLCPFNVKLKQHDESDPWQHLNLQHKAKSDKTCLLHERQQSIQAYQ